MEFRETQKIEMNYEKHKMELNSEKQELQVRAESWGCGGWGGWILYLKMKAITRIQMGVQFCKADESTTPAKPRPTKYNRMLYKNPGPKRKYSFFFAGVKN
jgi:hypothetical protein